MLKTSIVCRAEEVPPRVPAQPTDVAGDSNCRCGQGSMDSLTDGATMGQRDTAGFRWGHLCLCGQGLCKGSREEGAGASYPIFRVVPDWPSLSQVTVTPALSAPCQVTRNNRGC